MRNEVQRLLQKQAAWQRSRASRPWADKLRESVAVRRGCAAIREHPPDRRAKRDTVRYWDITRVSR